MFEIIGMITVAYFIAGIGGLVVMYEDTKQTTAHVYKSEGVFFAAAFLFLCVATWPYSFLFRDK
jgi:hypothetical protein